MSLQPRTFGSPVDLLKNEIRNGVVQNLASAPSTPGTGQIYFDTTSNVLKYYDGSMWQTAGGSGGSGMSNPMTTAGDIIIENSTPAPTRLAVGSTGQTLSVASGLPTWVTPASAQVTSASPTGTTNTTGLMMGIAGSITPAKSGTLLLIATGYLTFGSVSNGSVAKTMLYYGTSTAPSNGASLTGTASLSVQMTQQNNASIMTAPFCCTNLVTGLTIGIAYWLDMAVAMPAGGASSANVKNVTISAVEL